MSHVVLGDVTRSLLVADGQAFVQWPVIDDDPGGVEAALAREPFDLRGQGNDLKVVLIAVDDAPEP